MASKGFSLPLRNRAPGITAPLAFKERRVHEATTKTPRRFPLGILPVVGQHSDAAVPRDLPIMREPAAMPVTPFAPEIGDVLVRATANEIVPIAVELPTSKEALNG